MCVFQRVTVWCGRYFQSWCNTLLGIICVWVCIDIRIYIYMCVYVFLSELLYDKVVRQMFSVMMQHFARYYMCINMNQYTDTYIYIHTCSTASNCMTKWCGKHSQSWCHTSLDTTYSWKCINTRIYIYVYIYMCACTSLSNCTPKWGGGHSHSWCNPPLGRRYVSIYIHIYIYICVCINMFIYTYVYVYICACAYMCICVCI